MKTTTGWRLLRGAFNVIVLFIILLKVNTAQAGDPPSIDLYLDTLDNSIFAHVVEANFSENTSSYMKKKVSVYLKFFSTTGRDTFQKWLNQAGPYLPLIKDILREEGVPEDLALLPLIESGFNVNAMSSQKALGLWQFMASTGGHYGLKVNRWVDERKDPVKSTRAAARHLRDLHDEFGTWSLALASYNAGRGRVKRALYKTGASTYWDIGHSRVLRRETRNYVPKFMAALIIARNPDEFGFSLPEDNAADFDMVAIPGGMDLHTIAQMTGVDYSVIRKLNPGLKWYITPIGETSYMIRLPEGAGKILIGNFEQFPAAERIAYMEHRVKRGDSVYEIAKQYGTSISVLKKINNLNSRFRIFPGESILIPATLPSDAGELIRLVKTFTTQPDT